MKNQRGLSLEFNRQAWVADITCIHIRTGFVYLAAIMDAYSRKEVYLCEYEAYEDVVARLFQFR